MPTWGGILAEAAALEEDLRRNPPGGPNPPSLWDIIRRRYLGAHAKREKRAAIVYFSGWLQKSGVSADVMEVTLADVHGFMEAVSNVEERELDLFLHTPGGSPEAAESVMAYLRQRFDHIRAIVPLAAMSAGTMMALACDEIVMGQHSQLGPIDPQFTLATPDGPRSAPGQLIIDQWEMARADCGANPQHLVAWMPMLRALLPGLLARCEDSRQLAETNAADNLAAYMMKDDPARAGTTAKWFADYANHHSHSRRISRDSARAQGLKIIDLEHNNEFQDSVLSVFHSMVHTASSTPAAKIIENHHGRAYIASPAGQMVQFAPPPAGGLPAAPTPRRPATPGGQSGNRRSRRNRN